MKIAKVCSVALVGAVALTTIGITTAHGGEDTERPGAPRDLTAPEASRGEVELSWWRSTDDTGIRTYRLWGNGRVIAEYDDAATTPFPSSDARRIVADLPHGPIYLQLQAVDRAGNESVKTAPVIVDVDRVRPPAPVIVSVDDVTPEAPSGAGVRTDETNRRGSIVFVRFELPDPSDVVTCTLLSDLEATRIGRFVPRPDPDDSSRYTVSGVHESGPAGGASFQLFCTDAVGNDSVRSAPVFAGSGPEPE